MRSYNCRKTKSPPGYLLCLVEDATSDHRGRISSSPGMVTLFNSKYFSSRWLYQWKETNHRKLHRSAMPQFWWQMEDDVLPLILTQITHPFRNPVPSFLTDQRTPASVSPTNMSVTLTFERLSSICHRPTRCWRHRIKDKNPHVTGHTWGPWHLVNNLGHVWIPVFTWHFVFKN